MKLSKRQCTPHIDTNEHKYAGVLYLNTPEECNGGTSFWKNKYYAIMVIKYGNLSFNVV